MTEHHSARLHREAAEQFVIEARREAERAFRIQTEQAMQRLWRDLITGATAIGFMRELGFQVSADDFQVDDEGDFVATDQGWAGLRALMPIINRRWMKDFLRRDEAARVGNARWKT